MPKTVRSVCCALCLAMLLFAVLAPQGKAQEQLIDVSFSTIMSSRGRTWAFPYDDAFFMQAADVYSHDVAQASCGLAIAAGRSNPPPSDASIVSFLTQAGFEALEGEDYHVETSQHTIASMIGHKTLPDGSTLLAVGVSGIGYGNEWLSNLDVGDEQEHRGFAYAAEKVRSRILAYMEKHHLGDNCRLWISGYSRAAAVTNLAAASLLEQEVFTPKNAFVYTFASPRTSRSPIAYPNIFNILGKFDPATRIPYSEWGYSRHGVDLYTPAQETDSDYRQRRIPANAVYEKLTGAPLDNSTEVNHNFTIIGEYLTTIIPDAAHYDSNMHPHLQQVWESPNLTTVRALLNALSSPVELSNLSDMEHKEKVEDLVDYLAGIVYGVVTESLTERDTSTSEAAVELLLEHQPEVYLAWLFSSDQPADVYSEEMRYLHLMLEGDANVTLFDQKGGFLLTVDPDGNRMLETDVPRYQRRLRPMEERTLIASHNLSTRRLVLPKDQGIPFVIDALSDDQFAYYGVDYHIDRCQPSLTGVRIIDMEKGEQYLAFSFTEDGMLRMGANDSVWGDADATASFAEESMLLSMEITASLEEFGTVSISLKTILKIVIAVLVVLVVLLVLFVILVIKLIRKLIRRLKGRKRGGTSSAA